MWAQHPRQRPGIAQPLDRIVLRSSLAYLESGDREMKVQIPLETMTVAEKLRALEDIWADLRRQPEDIPSPDWHRDVLKARERTDGSSGYEDWTVVKERIRKKI